MNDIQILVGDCRETLKQLPDNCVQICVTSPPYFALRDYGHESQIGQEEMPETYVDVLRSVFKEVMRVLKKDGTLWLNLGDTYASNGTYINAWLKNPKNIGKTNAHTRNATRYKDRKAVRGGEYAIKKKDLIGIPWRVAFALQADGWYLRNSIIWNKTSALPNPAKDRFNNQHELIFLFSKSPLYYFDQSQKTGDVWAVRPSTGNGEHFATFPSALIEPCILAGSKAGDVVLDPFGGSGTTGKVALEYGRRAILCELNPEYVKIINERTNVTRGFQF
jgi:DNA modification methylase